MIHLSWLEINLARLEANLAAVRTIVGPTVAICGVIKAGAYGLGAVRLAQRLTNSNVDMLAVYGPDQAQEIVAGGVHGRPLLLLAPLREVTRTSELYRSAVSGRLHLTIHDMPQLSQINRVGQLFGCRMPVHLYLDTGMSRSGLNADQFLAALDQLDHFRHLQLAGIYTHLATADRDAEFTQTQMTRFTQWLGRRQNRIAQTVLIHAANTFATLRSRSFHHSMVRVGLALLGYGDDLVIGQPLIENVPRLFPIVRWLSRINHIQRWGKGAPVGYGCTHHLRRASVLGIVPVGYGDGYPLALGNRAAVRVKGTDNRWFTAPVVGQVSMDQIVIDLTAYAEDRPAASSQDTIAPPVGSLVELISDDPSSPCGVRQLAEQAGSNCYELLCRLSPRLPRRYIHSTSPVPTVPTPDPPKAGTVHGQQGVL